MRAAVAAGAGLINDVRALREDGALDAAAALGVPVILMHMLGDPRTMQDDPQYDDVVGDVHRFLTDRLFACQMAGIDKKKILVDPGFGFGKTLEHNLLLLRDLARFAEIAPVVAGLSRKGMIGTLTGRKEHAERAAGSAAAALIAVQNGAAIVRVHDVAVTRDALAGVARCRGAGCAAEAEGRSEARKLGRGLARDLHAPSFVVPRKRERWSARCQAMPLQKLVVAPTRIADALRIAVELHLALARRFESRRLPHRRIPVRRPDAIARARTRRPRQHALA